MVWSFTVAEYWFDANNFFAKKARAMVPREMRWMFTAARFMTRSRRAKTRARRPRQPASMIVDARV